MLLVFYQISRLSQFLCNLQILDVIMTFICSLHKIRDSLQISFLTSSPIIESLILRPLPATHHGEVCDYQSSVGSYRSHYITISSSFTDDFLPSSPHNISIRRLFRRLCYRRCLIAGTYPI